jgi:hypothetical protein
VIDINSEYVNWLKSLELPLVLYSAEQLENLLTLCRKIAGTSDILEKFEKTTRVKFQQR